MPSECQSVSEKCLKAKATSGAGDEPNTKTFGGGGVGLSQVLPFSLCVCMRLGLGVGGWGLGGGGGGGRCTHIFVLSHNSFYETVNTTSVTESHSPKSLRKRTKIMHSLA